MSFAAIAFALGFGLIVTAAVLLMFMFAAFVLDIKAIVAELKQANRVGAANVNISHRMCLVVEAGEKRTQDFLAAKHRDEQEARKAKHAEVYSVGTSKGTN